MRILCIGDSNTWGYNSENGSRFEKRWTKVLAELMPEDEIIEEGLCGRTLVSMDYMKRERCGMDALKMLLMTHKPVDCVIVMLGTNDLKRYFNANAYYIAGGVCEFIKVIRNPYTWERFAIPQLLVISPILLGDSILEKDAIYGEFDENSVIQSKHMAKTISKVCDDYGVDFMNAADYAEASTIDAIHMDEENHQKLAKAVYKKLNEMQINVTDCKI